MSELSNSTCVSNDETNIAEQFVSARLAARPLTHYPGAAPSDPAAAYRCQDAAIARWPEPIGGWKVSMFLSPEQQALCGGERMMGPAFASSIRSAVPGQVLDCAVIGDGWPGVEAEIVIRVGRDAPPDKLDWSIDEASEMVGELCIGVEVVSSALCSTVKLNVATCVTDFGLNFGIVVGRPISQWRTLKEVAAQVFIDGEPAARFPRGVTTLHERNGALGGFAFALGHCASRGYPLRAGSVIATGTITGGLINLQPGQTSRHVFEGIGEVLCRAVQATPRSQTPSR